jgi:hypothetical protein
VNCVASVLATHPGCGEENRSFDSYFGTYPGADGIPRRDGVATVCSPSLGGSCVPPFPDHADVNGGGPHEAGSAIADIANGTMNGFVATSQRARRNCAEQTTPTCAANAGNGLDVMGYHTQSDLPNYWSYAQNFVPRGRFATMALSHAETAAAPTCRTKTTSSAARISTMPAMYMKDVALMWRLLGMPDQRY